MSPKALLITTLDAGTVWWRIHRMGAEPLWFGPGADAPPVNRFDAPNREYRVGYFGTSREAAFAEVFLRVAPVEIITMREVEGRLLSRIVLRRAVRLAQLHGTGLARAGITATTTTGADYARARRVALEIWSGPDKPDGVLYRARHDDGELSVALFHTSGDAVEADPGQPLMQDRRWFSGLPARYGFEFSP